MIISDTFAEVRLISRREIADFLGVHMITVRRWEAKGMLTPIKISERVVRYHPEDVMKLIAGKQQQEESTT
jgi:predicted site-specific integrase-resolvase